VQTVGQLDGRRPLSALRAVVRDWSVPLEVRLEVKDGDEGLGWLRLLWKDGRSEINRDEELALELVVDAVGERAARLMAQAEADPKRVVAMRR